MNAHEPQRAPARRWVHRTDFLSLVFGTLFVLIGSLALVDHLRWSLLTWRWGLPIALGVLGAAVLAAAARPARRHRDEPLAEPRAEPLAERWDEPLAERWDEPQADDQATEITDESPHET